MKMLQKSRFRTISLYIIVGILGTLAATWALLPLRASADSLALTITPPFFQLNVSPGDSWSSAIDVINTNATDLTVYASAKAFAPSDEEGHGKFFDQADVAGDEDALANWIAVSSGPYTIPAGKEAAIPFSIKVPNGASPGGHYAAILIGNQPANTNASGSRVSVSSFISSLIFVRVSGAVIEKGSITEFSTDRSVYQEPDANFTIRFRNDGNVHLKPEGEVEIYNAWGKERGKVDINQENGFGYVLPSSTRKFDFEWKGDPSIFDFGEYHAIVSLAYGDDGRQSVSQTVTFWVIPAWRIALVLGGTLFFLFIFVIAIRRYVRRAMELEMKRYRKNIPISPGRPTPPPRFRVNELGAPLAEGVIDLRDAYRRSVTTEMDARGVPTRRFELRAYLARIKKYATPIVLLVMVMLGIVWMLLYGRSLLGANRSFEIQLQDQGSSPSLLP